MDLSEEIKFLAIYLDNSCEAHFNSIDNAKLFLSPCGSEFVFRTYDPNTSVIQNNLKYRTAYPISAYFQRLSRVLSIRNRFCDDRPFVSPILEEQLNASQIWTTAELIEDAVWEVNGPNSIQKDNKSFSYCWRSKCGRAELRLHFNKAVAWVTYPVRIPRTENDELEIMSTTNERRIVSKYIYNYTRNEQELSTMNVAHEWSELVRTIMKIVSEPEPEESKQPAFNFEVRVKLPDAMPLSCPSTHMHRFDDIPVSSEPKVIFIDNMWYKVYFKSKIIEIYCPNVRREFDDGTSEEYYVSDCATGKYFTCYGVNKIKGNIDEIKISLDNLPSFRTHTRKVLNYASILLKRVASTYFLSTFSICYQNKNIIDTDSFDQGSSRRSETSLLNASSMSTMNTTSSHRHRFDLNTINVRKQFFVEDTGYFKFYDDNSIIISFIDRVKLVVDEHSLENLLNGSPSRCFCSIFLPDNSQHEICLDGESRERIDGYFNKYLNFFDQWLDWLIKDGTITRNRQIRYDF